MPYKQDGLPEAAQVSDSVKAPSGALTESDTCAVYKPRSLSNLLYNMTKSNYAQINT